MTRAKYGNKKISVDGILFDSKKEAERWKDLCLMQRAGLISHLDRQVPFELIPEQREESKEVFLSGKHKGLPKPGKLLERPCMYIADFEYFKDGHWVVEDTKGVKTPEYIIKRKLMLERYGIRISEI